MNTEKENGEVNVRMVEIDRRQVILDFIIEHVGCGNMDIQKEARISMGRTVISKHVNDLINEGLVLNKGRKNRNVLIPNKENEITFIEEVILDFKKKYIKSLNVSSSHASFKNALNILNRGSDNRNKILEIGGNLGNLYSDLKHANNAYSQIDSLFLETKEIFQNVLQSNTELNTVCQNPNINIKGSTPYEILINRINTINSMDKDHLKNLTNLKSSNSIIKKLIKTYKEIVLKITNIRNLQYEYSSSIKKSGYLVLTSWPVFLFLYLTYAINLRSIIIWPKKIVNEILLFQLNCFVNKHLEEIKKILIDFLTKSKNERIEYEIESILEEGIDSKNKIHYFSKMYSDYCSLGMKKEIVDMLSCLNKFEKNVIAYDIDEKYLELMESSSNKILKSVN